MDETKYYVFYDGECGFCNHWVQWILKNDRKDYFRFAALQSEFGQRFLNDRRLENHNFNTLYLWKPKEFYLTKSRAVTKIAKILGGKYAFFTYLNIFPTFISDRIYDEIAKRRQKLASHKCPLPNTEEKKKFLN